MNIINTSEILAQSLDRLTYPANRIQVPRNTKLNLFMGIGIWSKMDGLSLGLPIDVMHMLLTATLLKSQIQLANPGKVSRIYLLIADSMALREGANKNKLNEMILIYKRCLSHLLKLLNLQDSTSIILSSDVESYPEYQDTLSSLEKTPTLQELKQDVAHYKYIRTQSAITHFMYSHRGVGVKIGWICAASSKQLGNYKIDPRLVMHWDELRFDNIYQMICPNSTLQYAYSKAGLRQRQIHERSVQVSEGCPYTAYEKDRRYVMQISQRKEIKTICFLKTRVTRLWKGVAQLCSTLRELNIINREILPPDCIEVNNNVATVYKMLNYWANISVVNLTCLPYNLTCLSYNESQKIRYLIENYPNFPSSIAWEIIEYAGNTDDNESVLTTNKSETS